VGFVVDKVALGQLFLEYLGLPFKSSSHKFLPSSITPAGRIGQYWPQFQNINETARNMSIIWNEMLGTILGAYEVRTNKTMKTK
jgi:hypothetical protein